MRKRSFSYRETADFCREMALMLHSGIGVTEALGLLEEEENDLQWRSMLSQLAQLTSDGEPFSEAIKRSGAFPAYMTGLIDVGEETGRLEEAFVSLAEYYDERERMNQRTRSALLYPSILLILMLAVIVVLLTKVLPILRGVYASLGSEMTGVAGVLLNVGYVLNKLMPVLIAVLIIVLAGILAFALSSRVREWVLGFWRSRAGDKGVMRAMNDACLARAISMGISSGLTMEDSLELAAQVLSDIPSAQERCRDCKRYIEDGESLIHALANADMFPHFARQLLSLAMRSGNADATMHELAQRLSDDADTALSKKIARIEPTLVLICSVLVGAVLLSVLMPLIDIMEMIG